MSVFKDLWWFFRMEKRAYAIGILVLLVLALTHLIFPYAVRVVIDQIAAGTLQMSDLVFWSVGLLAVAVFEYGLGVIWRLQLFGAANRLGRLLRDRLYRHYTKMSPAFYHRRRTGDLMAHATNDIQAVVGTAGDGVLTLVDSIISGGVVILTMVWFIDWRLTLVALIPMPFMAWATGKYGGMIHRRFMLAQEAFSRLNDKVQENISGVRVIKAFGQERAEQEEFERILDDVVRKNVAVAKVDALFDPTIQIVVGSSFFLAVAYGSFLVAGRELSLGELTQFTILLGQLIWPMLAFGWLFNIVERGRASHERIRNLLSVEPDITDREDASEVPASGDIEVRIRSFTYPGVEQPALRDIFTGIKRGQTLGIVGKTGSGKTTLLRLLLREFDVTDGEIRIGGKPVTGYQLEALRRSIGYVPQDHVLFSTTVGENIAFGKPDATREEIEEAARIACVHDDILNFEKGYDTVVGERGVTLSGGQKQRISIARAVLLDPEILVLDDALSAVDGRTEHAILTRLRENRKGKTTLIAAHRLSAVEHADLIVVLDEGRIVASGTHAELMETSPWYREMVEKQQLESLVLEGGGGVGPETSPPVS
ncbi:ABC transporter transmembrane domain-containing protein [Staphylospora marina]|uniref:ABC transporter transmembrane domain-containing protein n=1 Tax=Staphylospora marina TaxID=2490858 RepID=UPI000F5BF9F6|nr:ABC transporter transmembrane domain-containing protein [Staphylospora marina]